MHDTPYLPDPDDPNTDRAGSDPDGPGDDLLYTVAVAPQDCAITVGLTLPRRPHAGRRGVLLVDAPAGLVYVLDADDDAGVFRGRARRPLAGDPDETHYPPFGDHVVRAAYEGEYDVIAAPWAGDDGTSGDPASTPDPEPDPPKPRKRTSRATKAAATSPMSGG